MLWFWSITSLSNTPIPYTSYFINIMHEICMHSTPFQMLHTDAQMKINMFQSTFSDQRSNVITHTISYVQWNTILTSSQWEFLPVINSWKWTINSVIAWKSIRVDLEQLIANKVTLPIQMKQKWAKLIALLIALNALCAIWPIYDWCIWPIKIPAKF